MELHIILFFPLFSDINAYYFLIRNPWKSCPELQREASESSIWEVTDEFFRLLVNKHLLHTCWRQALCSAGGLHLWTAQTVPGDREACGSQEDRSQQVNSQTTECAPSDEGKERCHSECQRGCLLERVSSLPQDTQCALRQKLKRTF